MTFTLGRGTEVVVAAVNAMKIIVEGRNLRSIYSNFGKFWRELTSESQLRWIGPEKGVTHLAVAAINNGLWDLWAKLNDRPVWRLLADMDPEVSRILSAMTSRDNFWGNGRDNVHKEPISRFLALRYNTSYNFIKSESSVDYFTI